MQTYIFDQRISNAAELRAALDVVATVTDLRDVFLVKNGSNGDDIDHLYLIEETLTDQSVVYNLILS